MASHPKAKRVERWLRRLNESEHVLWLWFVLSFLETILVPVPIELVLVPYMVANRDRLWKTAAAVTVGCLVASMVGYGVGFYLFETLGTWLVRTFGWEGAYDTFAALFEQHGFFAVLAIGVIPIPFQIAMLVAGAARYPVYLFVIAAVVARGIRYFGLAALVAWVGDRAMALWREKKWLAILLLLAVLGGLSALMRWLGGHVTG